MSAQDAGNDASDFWDVASPLIANGSLVEGTIMSSDCVRDPQGEFVAMPNHQGAGLVVKISAERVVALIQAGTGKSFAPAGRVFREWVLVEEYDESLWTELLTESIAFVGG